MKHISKIIIAVAIAILTSSGTRAERVCETYNCGKVRIAATANKKTRGALIRLSGKKRC
jgi:hypothetical protein